MKRIYGRDFAERLIDLASGQDSMELRDDGVYLTEEWVEETKHTFDMGWGPQRDLPDADPSNRRKLLPIPFSSRDLAVFVLCPAAAGSPLTDMFQDNLKLDHVKLRDAFAAGEPGFFTEAIIEAADHLARAYAGVGPEDHTLDELAQSLCEEYRSQRRAAKERLGIASTNGHGLSDDEYEERINLVDEVVAEIEDKLKAARSRAAEEFTRRKKAMVAAINEPDEPPSSQPSSALTQDEVPSPVEKETAASDSVPGSALASTETKTEPPNTNQTSQVPDYRLLATKSQLIQAFKSFTGMDDKWFNNLKDKPALRSARKVSGRGGRPGYGYEAMYCPLAVMQWLIDPKRKAAAKRKISAETGWKLLKSHFPDVYNKYSAASPLDD